MKTIMNINRTILFCGIVAVSAGLALADQVVLKNGDRLTGSIVRKDDKNLTVRTDLFGVVTMAWDQIESIKADKPVTIVLQDGKSMQGTLATAGANLELTTSAGKQTVTLAQVTAIRDAGEQKSFERLLKPGWGELWAGSGSLGFAGSAGNSRTVTLTTGVNAARLTNRDRTSIYFSAIKASALINRKNSDTAEAIRGGLGYDRNVSSRLFINTFNDWETDKFQNLVLRFVLGGGLGFHLLKTPRSALDLVGGADYNRSSYSTPVTRSSAEAYWGDNYSRKLGGASSFTQSLRVFNDLTNTGTYRANFDAGVSTRLASWLTWNVSVSDRYLNHPATGRKTNDLLYITGLGITFAR